MRYAKVLLPVLIVVFGILFSCEAYQLQLTGLCEKDYFSFTGIRADDREGFQERFERIQSLLDNEDLEYYVVKVHSDEDSKLVYTVYSDERVQNKLTKAGYRQGKYNSFFSGKKIFQYGNWEDYVNRTELESGTDIIYVLNYDERKVSSSFLKEKAECGESRRTFGTIVYGMWGIIFLVLLLLTGLECSTRRKEWCVKIVYGYPEKTLLWGILFKNSLFYILLFLLCLVIFHPEGARQACGVIFLIEFGIFLILNLLTYTFSFLCIDYKKGFVRNVSSASLIKTSYLLRTLVFCAMVILLVYFGGQFKELKSMLNQRSFYTQFKGYFHLTMYSTGGDGNELGLPKDILTSNILYKEKLRDWEIIMLSGEGYLGVDFVLANVYAKDFVLRTIPSIAEEEIAGEGIYFLVPEKESDWQRKSNILFDYVVKRLGYSENDCKVLFYRDCRNLYVFTGMCDNSHSDISGISSPIIVLNTFLDISEQQVYESQIGRNFLLFAIKADFEQINSTAEIDATNKIQLVNIYEAFCSRMLTTIKRMIVFGVMLLLCFTLTVIFLDTIIQLEFSMKAMAFCISKINGMPFLVRYRSIFYGSLAVYGISIGVGGVMSLVITRQFSFYFVWGVLLMALTESLIITRHILRWERREVQRVLKGGAL